MTNFLPESASNRFFFKSAKNPARGFFRQTGHIGQVLMGEPDPNTDAIRLLNAGSLCEIDEKAATRCSARSRAKALALSWDSRRRRLK